jgi:RTX calcium-binding nonapeptide repeat (4 copies)
MVLARICLVGSLVTAAFAGSLAAEAVGAEVRLERFSRDCTRAQCPPDHGERLVVRGGPGEANRLSIVLGAGGEYQVTDAGPALQAGPGCVRSGEQLVACPTSTPLIAAYVLPGDGDDTVTSSVAVTVDGGSGDDRLVGSGFADELYGGRGRDVLRGNGGDDALRDGRLPRLPTPEEDEGRAFPPPPLGPVRAAPAESDLFDGGAGTDTLSYGPRRRGVIADLARADRHAGARGERDSLRGLERLEGGNGGDVLLGDDRANLLLGGEGDDLLVGRAGDDDLELDAGLNRARGGAGDDTISALRADLLERQRVACGPGRDRAADMFRNDFADDDCESVVIGEFRELDPMLPPASLVRPPLARYTTSSADCAASSCTLRLGVRLARSPRRRLPHLEGALLGRATATIPARAVTTLTVRLNGRGSRLLRRYRSLLIRINLNLAVGDPRTAAAGAYLTRLRAPS